MSGRWPVLLMALELNQGGTERQLAEIARSLPRDSFVPHVGTFRSGGFRWRELEAHGVDPVCFSISTLADPRGLVRIARYIRRHGIRLFHAFDWPAGLYGVPAARLGGADVVLSSQRGHRSLAPPRFRHWRRIADKMADGLVVNCEFLRNHLIADEHIPPGRIHLCYNGIDLRTFHPGPRTRPAPLQHASLVIGVVCVLRPEKDLLTLLDAFAAVRCRCPGMKLAIVGSGPCLPELEARAHALGIEEDCLFQPATADVPGWLHGIDIFVLPSLSEAFSNALMEAMSCGCCVVASRVGGNPELVTDGESGLLFEPGDSSALAAILTRLIDQPGERDRLGTQAAVRVSERFRVEDSARRMGEIYRGFLAPGA
jgi:glycosyltransferase involved in cell wall biosynthesis